MKRYFTSERIHELLRHCEELGINTWQSGPGNLDSYNTFRAQGGGMHYIPGARRLSGRRFAPATAAAGTIAIAHHGEATDNYCKSGTIDRMRTYCRKIRDTGVMVGVSAHIPEVVDQLVSSDWDVDFFMCCVYGRHRTREELTGLLGEVYLAPPGCSRRCGRRTNPVSPSWQQDACATGVSGWKGRSNGHEYEDQPAINAEYVRRFSGLRKPAEKRSQVAASG